MIRLEGDRQAYFKYVPMPSEDLVVLTLAVDPCRPPNAEED